MTPRWDLDAVFSDLEPGLKLRAQKLAQCISEMESVVVAFSGGVDSGLLCGVAYAVLGSRMLAVTVHSPVETPGDDQAAQTLALQVGFPHRVFDFNDLENPAFVANPPDRCYHCKLARFRALQQVQAEFGARFIVEGSNLDDRSDYRPGARAVAELGIRSPLAEAELSKQDIRALARGMGLSVWDRPSAPCLATRFPYGTVITAEGLRQVRESEAFLKQKGFHPVRVRHYGETARIEVAPAAFETLLAQRADIILALKHQGFHYIVLDLAGFRSGSMNEGLNL